MPRSGRIFLPQSMRSRFPGLAHRAMHGLLLAASAAVACRGLPASAVETQAGTVRFTTEVAPLLTRLGCNGGACHGKATGQNGFRLSLLGFEPDMDYQALVVEARGRRVLSAAPDHSLMLLKATGRIPHGGGRLIAEESDEYRVLRDWIAQGAPAPRGDDPRLERIEVSPSEAVLSKNASVQLRVMAFFSDGSTRDVTGQALYQSNEPDIAGVDAAGMVHASTHHGLVAIMAQFGGEIVTLQAAIPLVRDEAGQRSVQARLDAIQPHLADSAIDTLMMRQWRRLCVVPAPVADDATFLRRVMLDVCGTLPTPEDIATYTAASNADKKARLIDALLARPEYASYFAVKWGDILQNRGTGTSTQRQRPGTTLFANWIRDSLATNKPYDQFVSEIITASGPQNVNPPAVWYRTVRKSNEYVESVAQAFLGVRIQCAQCHHHPTEKWGQDDYYGLAAAFARVGRKGGFADAEVPTDEIIFLAEHGEVLHPRTGAVVMPRPLGGATFSIASQDDPRLTLARWITDPSNPYFARTMVNRMLAHFMGRGIVHPLDDARSTNPPSNPELLDALSHNFVASGYDIQQLVRDIVSSHAYSLESTPHEGNAGDTQTFARFYPRRLTAESLLDGISQVLDVPTEFPGLPAGTRAIELPDENVAARFLDAFGRPARLSACECERADAPALHQALELVNSAEIQRKLVAKTGYAQRLASVEQPQVDRATAAFVRVLGRPPRPDELDTAVRFLDSEPDRVEACRSLLWSLLATNEFLFNH